MVDRVSKVCDECTRTDITDTSAFIDSNSFLDSPTPLRGNDFIQGHFHVSSHVWISIFVDCQRRTRVLDEQVAQPHVNFPQIIAHGLQNIICNQMTTSARRRDTNFLLKPHGNKGHVGCAWRTAAAAATACGSTQGGRCGNGARNRASGKGFGGIPQGEERSKHNCNSPKLHEG